MHESLMQICNIHVKSLPTIMPKSFNKHNYNKHKNYTHTFTKNYDSSNEN